MQFADAATAGPTPITVVIPAFNAAATIERALSSVVEQTAAPCEVIVVDDGSTDDTGALARAFAAVAPVPVRVVTQVNGGVASARNVGVAAASSRFVGFLDADDAYRPRTLARLVALIAAEPEAAVAFGDAERVENGLARNASYLKGRLWDQTHYTRESTRPARLNDPVALLLFGSFVPHGAFIARRDLLALIGPCDPSLARAIDRDMLLRLAEASSRPWVFTFETLTTVHYTEGSLSSRANAWRHALAALDVLARYRGRYPNLPIEREALVAAAERCSAKQALFWSTTEGPLATYRAARRLPRSLPRPERAARALHALALSPYRRLTR